MPSKKFPSVVHVVAGEEVGQKTAILAYTAPIDMSLERFKVDTSMTARDGKLIKGSPLEFADNFGKTKRVSFACTSKSSTTPEDKTLSDLFVAHLATNVDIHFTPYLYKTFNRYKDAYKVYPVSTWLSWGTPNKLTVGSGLNLVIPNDQEDDVTVTVWQQTTPSPKYQVPTFQQVAVPHDPEYSPFFEWYTKSARIGKVVRVNPDISYTLQKNKYGHLFLENLTTRKAFLTLSLDVKIKGKDGQVASKRYAYTITINPHNLPVCNVLIDQVQASPLLPTGGMYEQQVENHWQQQQMNQQYLKYMSDYRRPMQPVLMQFDVGLPLREKMSEFKTAEDVNIEGIICDRIPLKIILVNTVDHVVESTVTIKLHIKGSFTTGTPVLHQSNIVSKTTGGDAVDFLTPESTLVKDALSFPVFNQKHSLASQPLSTVTKSAFKAVEGNSAYVYSAAFRAEKFASVGTMLEIVCPPMWVETWSKNYPYASAWVEVEVTNPALPEYSYSCNIYGGSSSPALKSIDGWSGNGIARSAPEGVKKEEMKKTPTEGKQQRNNPPPQEKPPANEDTNKDFEREGVRSQGCRCIIL